MSHNLYCPVCDRTITLDHAHEVSGRVCPGCATPASALWKSKEAYEAKEPAAPVVIEPSEHAGERDQEEEDNRGRKRRAR